MFLKIIDLYNNKNYYIYEVIFFIKSLLKAVSKPIYFNKLLEVAY